MQGGGSLYIIGARGPDLYIIGAARTKFVYNWCGRGRFGVCFFFSRGSSTVQMTPCSVESHLQIAKKETPKFLKREAIFSEKIKPENHFFVVSSYAIFFMVKGVVFCVRNCHFWTK